MAKEASLRYMRERDLVVMANSIDKIYLQDWLAPDTDELRKYFRAPKETAVVLLRDTGVCDPKLLPLRVFFYAAFEFGDNESCPAGKVLEGEPRILRYVPKYPAYYPAYAGAQHRNPGLQYLRLSALRGDYAPDFPISGVEITRTLHAAKITEQTFRPLFFGRRNPFGGVPDTASKELRLSA